MIDKKYIIRVLGRMICFVAVLALATACTGDELLNSSANGAEQEGLSISLTLDGMQLASRSASVQSLNEDAVKRMDVFLFGPNESFKKYATSGDGTSSVEKVTLYQGSSWKSEFDDASEYTLYVLANYKGDATKLSEINTVQGLKDLVVTDKDIALWERMTVGSGKYEGKTFLMDGKYEFKGSDLDKNQSTYNIPVDVKRAAVKVEVTLKYSDEWKNKFTATGLEAQFANYATATAAFAEAPMLDADKRGFTTYPEATTNVLERFSSAPVFETGNTDGKLHNGSKIRFYAYVNTWEQEVSNETMFLVDLPGKIVDEQHPENNKDLAHNFYKIPIVPNSQEKILNRNTFYQVTAVVDMEGSSTIDVPVELEDVKIEVADWESTPIDVGTGDNPEYLMLNEYHVEIRNVDGYDGLRFYSSAPIDKVEIVGFENQDEATKAGVDFTYPGDKTLEGSGWNEKETDKIPGAFYVNKDNKRKSVSGISVDFEPNVNNGWIHLSSKNPENVTKRYITLKVTSGDNVKYVVVEQYPLEYIQPIAGYYSYRDDFKSSGVTPSGVPCHWEQTFSRTGSTYDDDMPTSNTKFNSKVLITGKIHTYEFEWNRSLQVYEAVENGTESVHNNNMYFVSITKTDDQYKIAHPVLDEDGYTSDISKDCVSPMFMLASRLGTVQPMDYSTAQKHCASYVEVTLDGKRHLDDWRLPTKMELEIIERFQTSTPDVMDEVLALSKSGDETRYWGAGGRYHVRRATEEKGTWEDGTSTRYSVWIRCIRDVKPDEFK